MDEQRDEIEQCEPNNETEGGFTAALEQMKTGRLTHESEAAQKYRTSTAFRAVGDILRQMVELDEEGGERMFPSPASLPFLL